MFGEDQCTQAMLEAARDPVLQKGTRCMLTPNSVLSVLDLP